METTDSDGYCICVHCNTRIPHEKEMPCRENVCPQCGKIMMREGSYHHQLYLQKKGEINHESSSTDKGKCC
jgi:NAD-dependent SIR2 family protein deacetylase